MPVTPRHAVRTLTPAIATQAQTRISATARPLPIAQPVQLAEGADWTSLAACKGADPDELFVTGAAQNKVKTRCFSCVVRTECLADALDNRVEFGVWGGMTERERRALLRRRPEVRSWSQLFSRARTDATEGARSSVDLVRLVASA